MVEKSIPRKNYEVYDDEEKIGIVSSGTFCISLNKADDTSLKIKE